MTSPSTRLCGLTPAAMVTLLGLAACGSGSGTPPPAPPPWEAVEVSPDCTSGPGTMPRSSCRTLLVSGPNIPGLKVQLRVLEPNPAVPLRGTVLFGTGGDGNTFYGEQPGGDILFHELTQLGYRVVDRAWFSRWWGIGHSVRLQSRRYATLLTWVHDNVHTTGTYSAVGNSAGSGEVAYALSAWGRADLLDVAVLSSGPPMTRLDYICANTLPIEWQTRCASLAPPGMFTCGALTCALGPTTEGIRLCQGLSPNATPAMLHGESILHPGAATHYGSTRIHVIVGTKDCSCAVASGLLFYDEVSGDKVLEFAPNTPHFVPASAEGRIAVTNALLGALPSSSGPASLNASAWPKLGGRLDLHLHGRPGASYHLFLSLESSRGLEVPGLGWWFLGTPTIGLANGILPATGRATRTLTIPVGDVFRGIQLFDQALIGSRLSNLVRTTVLP